MTLMTSETLRIMLSIYIGLAAVIAVFYLRRRRLSVGELAFWGTLAIAVPVLGPFLVIAARPGPGPRSLRRKRLTGRSRL